MGRSLFVGIDGGASRTACIVADETGNVVSAADAGAMDHLYRSVGRARTRRALAEALGTALGGADVRGGVTAVVAGLTGLDSGTPEAAEAERMLRRLVKAGRVLVTSDVEVAFVGATGGRSGVMIIGGTGSVAFGRNAEGQTARAGGYGFLIDDAGGGVAIGQAALRAAMRAEDGRGRQTRLREMVRERLGDWPALRRTLYGESGGRVFLAGLTRMVEEAASGGDDVARQILTDAAGALAEMALTVARRLDMLDEEFSFFPVGGIFRIGELIMTPLKKELEKGAPRSRIDQPALAPPAGAVIMAMSAAGRKIMPEIVRRLGTSRREASMDSPGH